MRFGKFIKPVIQAYLSGEDIEDTVTKLNQFIIDNKIEVYKDYDYAKVFPPFSNQFLYHVINIHETDWKKTEPLWVVLKNRLESGKRYTKNRYLSEELRKILETEFETFKGYKRKWFLRPNKDLMNKVAWFFEMFSATDSWHRVTGVKKKALFFRK